jgi:hypothetical protein
MPEQTPAQLTSEELEKAVAAGSALVICDRNNFRLVIHGGLKYHCANVLYEQWAKPAGNRASDYRGHKRMWTIKKVEPDTGYQRSSKPRPALSANELVPKLKQAIEMSVDGRWTKEHFYLVSPANVQTLIAEIERLRPALAA